MKTKYDTEDFQIVYIITRRLNQDAYHKPSTLQFKYRLRWYILAKRSNDMFNDGVLSRMMQMNRWLMRRVHAVLCLLIDYRSLLRQLWMTY